MIKLDFAVGWTILKIYIFVVGRWKRRSVGILMIGYGRKKKTRKGRKKKRKTKRTVTILERRARRRASSSPAERMW